MKLIDAKGKRTEETMFLFLNIICTPIVFLMIWCGLSITRLLIVIGCQITALIFQTRRAYIEERIKELKEIK